MLYLFVFLLFFVLSFRYDYMQAERGRKFWIITTLIILILIAGLRYRIGTDSINYASYFRDQNSLLDLRDSDFDASRFAPGYIYLTSFVKLFTEEFVVVQLIQSIFVNCVIFWFMYKYCRHFFFGMLIFLFYEYYLLLFEQMREGIAVAFFLLAWPAFKEKKWLIWYLLSVVALFFHISAIIMFFLPLLYVPGIKQLFIFGGRTWIVAIGVLIIAIAVQAVFFRYIQMIALTDSMAERAETYESNALSGSILNFGGIISVIIRNILYPVLALYFLQRNHKLAGNYSNRFIPEEGFALMSVYVSIFSIVVAIVSRYNNYFFFFAILMMSDWAFSKIKTERKSLKLRFSYWVILFLPMFAFQFYSSYLANLNKSGTIKNYSLYYPYASYFDQTLDEKREAAFRYRRTL